MQKLETQRVRVSRQSVRGLWWMYVSGISAVALATAIGALDERAHADAWTLPQAISLALALAAAITSHRLMMGLPPAGHPIFDTVGERFASAMRQLFLRFVLAGAAAEVAGLLGAVMFVLGAPGVVSLAIVTTALVLLHHLKRRVAPVVHYLA